MVKPTDRCDIVHDSHDAFFRNPFGAVPCGTVITLRLRAVGSALPDAVRLRLWSEARGEEWYPLELHPDGGNAVYECKFAAASVPGLMWYHFQLTAQGYAAYYGASPGGLGGRGQLYAADPASYQITVYRPDAATPHWYKDAIVYQIFVDRFYNSNEGGKINSPPPGSLLHAYWDNTPFYVRDTRTGRIFAYDFFGGNLAGVIAKLPYLQELGVTAIYFNPIFESPSNHKYDTGDYKKIDPMFGDNELFRRLCAEAAARGIRIILDGVFSHTGSDSIYFNKAGRYPGLGAYQSTASPYFAWYRFSRHPDKYESWWGIDTLPNVNELEPSYLDFIINNEDSVLNYWFSQGVSGWRLDVADELPDEFIKKLRQAAKTRSPESILIGEVWEDASRKISYGVTRQYLLGDELDSVTNYPLRSIMLDFILRNSTASDTQRKLLSLYENYPREHFYSTLNMLGSHDVPRILTLLGEAPPQETMSIIDQANYRLPPDKRALAAARLKLMALWLMTFPGVPCIYYGDEAGLEGYADPFNRRTYPWGNEDPELLDWFKKLTALRRRHAALSTGEWLPLPAADDVYGYIRRIAGGLDVFGQARRNNVAIVLFNRSHEASAAVSLDLSGYCRDFVYDALTAARLPLPDGKLEVELKPLEGKLLLQTISASKAFARSSGVLLHPTSLPSPYGIGDLGPEAYAFVDWLAAGGQKYWQVLPLNPPGFGASPYQSCSAFAGSPWLISPDLLVADGLLTTDEVIPPPFPQDKVAFSSIEPYKENLLRLAFTRFRRLKTPPDYLSFAADNQLWLENYALYMALKEHFREKPWREWGAAAARDNSALAAYAGMLSERINYHMFVQYIYFRQWRSLKEYANSKGIQIIGDLPIFVAYESSDVWANQHLFDLDADGRPASVAGVPPDYFSATGQLWGNPHYNWQAMAADGYRWWRHRISRLLQQVDVIRIDHFRGFDAYWQVAADAATAQEGRWVPGPGADFFATLERDLGLLPIIAEDLGIITPSVELLRDMFNFPGMKVLHFLFEGNAANFAQTNVIVYTGTHDNDTTLGWYRQTPPATAAAVKQALGLPDDAAPAAVCWGMIEFAMASPACVAIIPLQDILCLGSEARMNRPGTVGGNWDWRCRKEFLTPALAHRLADLTRKHGR
ncbi:MAG: bifunctional glycogen debranching protein GlgX/4-alpha-glucanotransferase [Negativicutes bacterium]|nr:bifunctional glycogen debranching protein GlgX/4-alpha-glucanotransferase [Negativicutes bacterium]